MERIPVARGYRVRGQVREKAKADIVREYKEGKSIRDLATESGRSYGFIHKILDEARVKFRKRGGNTRKRPPSTN
ncbi:helix-turn-helix domain-containing protein [Streptomyces malaysiensis]|uniref:helix-turn-helix domain-containing protein n=1 Tax=Streptomyces malaysiensis TaxID=92644 RepID=UPI0028C47113|nr:helix-turn-helix domain-containing protein [Streptomyces malaysiensis]